MPLWLQVLLGVGALLGPWLSGYFGTQRGMSVGIARLQEQIKALEREVKEKNDALRNQIGRAGNEGMRLLVHEIPQMKANEKWLLERITELKARLERLESRGDSR